MSVKVCASILSANFLKLGEELKRAEEAGCDSIHVDVMDGTFVENLAIGICVAKWLPLGTKLRLEAHMAIVNPQHYVDAFADIGMHAFLFHPEAYCHQFRLIDQIKKRNMLAGVALSPSTSIESIRHILPSLDIIDQLAVDAGFSNQTYRTAVNEKLRLLRELKQKNGYAYEIQIDGGINIASAPQAIEAGAEVLVSGSTLFESNDMAAVVRALKGK